MHLVFLCELLEAEENECLARLQRIQSMPRERLTSAGLAHLALNERKLVNEMSHLRRTRLHTRIKESVVVIMNGGAA